MEEALKEFMPVFVKAVEAICEAYMAKRGEQPVLVEVPKEEPREGGPLVEAELKAVFSDEPLTYEEVRKALAEVAGKSEQHRAIVNSNLRSYSDKGLKSIDPKFYRELLSKVDQQTVGLTEAK